MIVVLSDNTIYNCIIGFEQIAVELGVDVEGQTGLVIDAFRLAGVNVLRAGRYQYSAWYLLASVQLKVVKIAARSTCIAKLTGKPFIDRSIDVVRQSVGLSVGYSVDQSVILPVGESVNESVGESEITS